MRLIFLHGWGANAADLLPLGEALQAQLPPTPRTAVKDLKNLLT